MSTIPDVHAVATASSSRVRIEPLTRRLRVMFAGVCIADTDRAVYLFETAHLPVYYVPKADVRFDLCTPSEHTTHCPYKGDAVYWHLQVGERRSENALWGYPTPIAGCPDISDYVAFYWDRVDAWFEEDDEVFVHPRDPYKRIDVLHSSKHVQVLVDGQVVADSHRPRLLFETGLPTRYYLPKVDVRMDLLLPSATHTSCPYKGVASYFSVQVGDKRYDDIVWTYPSPIAEIPKIEQLLCFFNEKVDIVVDGVRQSRPVSPWSDT
jgi:uncharacterized protein (DUF427 family)